jgi:hypothetical protein
MRAIDAKTAINAAFVRRLIREKAHTQVSAAHAIGISPRTMGRYVSKGSDYRTPPVVVLWWLTGVALLMLATVVAKIAGQ